MYIPDLALEYPDLEAGILPPNNITLNKDSPLSRGVLRAWNLRPNVHRQIVGYKEDSGSYAESGVDFFNDFQNGHPYFNGAERIELCGAHGIREDANRSLFTLAVTMSPNVLGIKQYMFAGYSGYIALLLNTSNLILFNKAGSAALATSSTVAEVGKLYRIVIVYDRDNLVNADRHKLYVNGVLEDSNNAAAASFSWYTNPFCLGCRSPGYYHFKGMIDHPVIWGRPLNDAEVMMDYKNQLELYRTI